LRDAAVPLGSREKSEVAIKDRSRLDDHYSEKARSEGYPARSVYKLAEIEKKKKLFWPGQKVLDLGFAPGSWTLYAAEKVGPQGLVVGVDLNVPKKTFPAWVKLMEADVLKPKDALLALREAFVGGADGVMSDLAPKTTGRKEVDQAKSQGLIEAAWAIATELLKDKGWFLFKVFQSPEGDEFMAQLRGRFADLTRLKPKATRKASQEIFALFTGYSPKGREP
jgi:23S rRNA (uridine2552-2'-O)-methyltransferase